VHLKRQCSARPTGRTLCPSNPAAVRTKVVEGIPFVSSEETKVGTPGTCRQRLDPGLPRLRCHSQSSPKLPLGTRCPGFCRLNVAGRPASRAQARMEAVAFGLAGPRYLNCPVTSPVGEPTIRSDSASTSDVSPSNVYTGAPVQEPHRSTSGTSSRQRSNT